jgi:hypothetical protein
MKVGRKPTTYAKIAPNPANGEITIIVANTDKGDHDVTFINAIGSKLLSTTWTKTSDTYSDEFGMDVSTLPSGVYQVVIRTATDVLTVPLIIVK